jgi:S1-C subfamily serine protease
MSRVLVLAAAAALWAGSALAEGVGEIVVPAPQAVVALPPDAHPKGVSLTRFRADIPTGHIWRQDMEGIHYFLPCGNEVGLYRWTEDNNKIEGFDAFDRVFREEMQAGGFKSGRDPTNLFEEQTGSDLQVGALITDLRMKTCLVSNIATSTYTGTAVMDVEWQVYSVSQGRILARITTHGGFQYKHVDKGIVLSDEQDPFPIVRGVFADNVHRLMADEGFRAIATSSASSTTGSSPLPPAMTLAAVGGPTPINEAVRSVVSIFAGDGMGSGVLISPDGYILTNHHVAGSSGQVRIRWADGTETVGDVLRADPRRDVALVRTTAKAPPLAIRRAPTTLGEAVFAVGTPLRTEFANTLTRGVISGERRIEGLSYLQSDVAIDHGNSGGPLLDEQGRIVALTVSRFEPDGVGHGINFFIPIDEALKALNLSTEAQGAPAAPTGRK